MQGRLQAELYERDGEARISLKLVAEHVLALRQPPKEKTSKPKPARVTSPREEPAMSPDLNDPVPF